MGCEVLFGLYVHRTLTDCSAVGENGIGGKQEEEGMAGRGGGRGRNILALKLIFHRRRRPKTLRCIRERWRGWRGGGGKVRLSLFPKKNGGGRGKVLIFPLFQWSFSLSLSLGPIFFRWVVSRSSSVLVMAPPPPPPSSSFPLPPRRKEKKGKRAIFGSAKTGRIIAGPVNISRDFFHKYFSPGIETRDPPLGCEDAVSP